MPRKKTITLTLLDSPAMRGALRILRDLASDEQVNYENAAVFLLAGRERTTMNKRADAFAAFAAEVDRVVPEE